MKILFISANWGRGGPGGVVKDLYSYMESCGEECWFAYARGKTPDGVRSIRIGSRLTVAGHVCLALCFDSCGFHSAAATRAFVREIDRLRPDVINLHNIIGFSLHVGILFDYLRGAGIPVVWTVHDCWPFTGHCIFYDDVGCDKWRKACGRCPARLEYPPSLLLDFSERNLRKKKKLLSGIPFMELVTPSRWLAEVIGETYLDNYPLRVINNGIDLQLFKPTASSLRQQYGLMGKKIVLGVASVWAMRKGLDSFVRLSRMLDPAVFSIVLIGVSARQRKRLPSGILALPRTKSASELAQWYSAADVFVNPTLADNYPTVNLEALACGTPVITYETGGSPERITRSNGCAVRKGDLAALCEAIETCNLKADGFLTDLRLLDRTARFEEYRELFQTLSANSGGQSGDGARDDRRDS